MSIVTVQIGQCGNQLGSAFFDALAAEPGAAPTFFRDGDDYDSSRSGSGGDQSRRQQQPRMAARAVLVDMEPKVIEAAVARAAARRAPGAAAAAAGRWSYAGAGTLARHSGAANNWAVGHNELGPLVRDEAVDLVRREAEAADWLQGLLLLQSVAGGTGSGLGTLLAEALADELRPSGGPLVSACVWPYEAGEVAVQPYNAVLAAAGLADACDGVLMLENGALHAACTRLLGVARPSFADLNGVAARALACALLPASGRPVAGGADPAAGPSAAAGGGLPMQPLADIAAHVTPSPRYRLASVRAVPTVAPGALDRTTFAWPALLRRLRQMAITGSFVEEGLDWAVGAAAAAKPAGGTAASATPLPAHRYRNRAAASMLVLRGAGAAAADASELADPLWHSGWWPAAGGGGVGNCTAATATAAAPLVGASPARFAGCQMAAALVASDQAAAAPLARMAARAARMAGARAYLHQYEAAGLDEGSMLAALGAAEDIVAAYDAL